MASPNYSTNFNQQNLKKTETKSKIKKRLNSNLYKSNKINMENGQIYDNVATTTDNIIDDDNSNPDNKKKERPQGRKKHGNYQNRYYNYKGMPLRILVPVDFIGAIYGKGGARIKTITQDSGAKISIDSKENIFYSKKLVSIYGECKECESACLQILNATVEEDFEGDMTLCMLAEDCFCGMIIGKQGRFVNKIRDESNSQIFISKNVYFDFRTVSDSGYLYSDRVVTLVGTVTNILKAAVMVFEKLKHCYENDYDLLMSSGIFVPNSNLPSFPINNRVGYYGNQGQNMNFRGNMGYYPMMPHTMHGNDSIQINVPNSSIGGIIGRQGVHINKMMNDSKAKIKVQPKDGEEEKKFRIVTVEGCSDSQYKATRLIFERVKFDLNVSAVKLFCAIKIPKESVGVIIGKGGKTIQKIKKLSKGTIKLPDKASEETEEEETKGDDTVVQIYGSFFSVQSAISNIRDLLCQNNMNRSVNFQDNESPNFKPRYDRNNYRNDNRRSESTYRNNYQNNSGGDGDREDRRAYRNSHIPQNRNYMNGSVQHQSQNTHQYRTHHESMHNSVNY